MSEELKKGDRIAIKGKVIKVRDNGDVEMSYRTKGLTTFYVADKKDVIKLVGYGEKERISK